ncbi:hypothetical protein ACFY0F_29265 [Streptomyces sp. NPDC001544]|uniref:hypothetical protein n=1 Tax=Streptomyces sp. NPDC001544 TaxID=3364584 RepID=UPI0036B5DC08
MTEVERIGRGWHTLLERGLLHGRIRYEGAFAGLDLDHVPAPWLLGVAALVSAYNTAYERVYPGALTRTRRPCHRLDRAQSLGATAVRLTITKSAASAIGVRL